MPKVTLTEFASTGDPLLDDNFEMIFNVPAAVGGTSYTSMLRIQCKTGAKPGSTLEEVVKEAFGFQLGYAGRKTFSRSFSTEFNENSDMAVYKPLEKWHEMVRGTETQLGAFKKDYATKAIFRIFKQDGSIAGEYEIFNVWPKQVPDLAFNGTAQSIPVNVEWAFDWVKEKA